ncbi:MAG: Hpt domain-containing protein [Victivallales bacterium]|nr:Hpt domain-containing protein [Victivallales bacterium]
MKEEIYTYLKEQFGDDKDTIEAVYAEYCTTVHERIADIQKTFEAKDMEQVRHLAHTLKGDTAIVGDSNMNEHAKAFEAAVKASDLETCKSELAILVALLPEA